jgi:hypothetical protein
VLNLCGLNLDAPNGGLRFGGVSFVTFVGWRSERILMFIQGHPHWVHVYNSYSTDFLEKLTVVQLVLKISAFYVTRIIISAFTKSPPFVPIVSHLIPLHVPTSYFFEICFNIIS